MISKYKVIQSTSYSFLLIIFIQTSSKIVTFLISFQDAASGKIYKTIMEKIIEKGDDFVKTEHDRIKKLLSEKISDEKKKNMAIRINILQTFQLHKKTKGDKQEL